MEWVADPLVIGLLGLAAIAGLIAGMRASWRPLLIAEYIADGALLVFAIMWAGQFSSGAVYMVAAGGIGTWLAQDAVHRGRAARWADKRS